MDKTFAVISEDKVINVIVAESKEIAELVTELECIEYTSENPMGIGWVRNLETGAFFDPFIELESEVAE